MQRLSAEQELLFNLEDLPKDRACQWDEIQFKEVLGSGSFGDCFRAFFRQKTCCVKKMRATLFDEEGARGFVRGGYLNATNKYDEHWYGGGRAKS